MQPGTEAGILSGRSIALVMTVWLRHTLWPSIAALEIKASGRGFSDSSQPADMWEVLFIDRSHLQYARYHLHQNTSLSGPQQK